LTPPSSAFTPNAAPSTSENVANSTTVSEPTYHSTVRERVIQTSRARKNSSTQMPKPAMTHSVGTKSA
jgi:hypothetical protein